MNIIILFFLTYLLRGWPDYQNSWFLSIVNWFRFCYEYFLININFLWKHSKDRSSRKHINPFTYFINITDPLYCQNWNLTSWSLIKSASTYRSWSEYEIWKMYYKKSIYVVDPILRILDIFLVIFDNYKAWPHRKLRQASPWKRIFSYYISLIETQNLK